ncbi:MAG: gamma-glutamyl-gamma-aminobutyrate hydrolase family protein [Dehalococcoidia bacterium]|jgi:putative glutamine amidotransferase
MTARVVLSLGGNSRASDDCYIAALGLPGLDLEVCPVYPATGLAELRELLGGASGLVLSGGADVDPARYGERPAGAEMQHVNPARDAVELAALDEAETRELPVLAICRGVQVLNVHRGGALLQDIGQSHRDGRKQEEKWRAFHPVEIAAGSVAAQVLGTSRLETNSRHHQALDPGRLGDGLVVTGRCPGDGVIEAVELPGQRFLVGVQWHPENMALAPADSPERAQARRLFAAFAEAARARGPRP